MATTLITGRPWRVILAFSVPLLIGNVVQQLYQFVDAVVVGRHLGVNSLAAVGASGSLIFLVIGFAWGLGSGFAIPTAQAFGASDARGVRRSVATGTVLTAATSLILTVLGPLMAEPLLRLLQTPPELLAESTAFTQATFIGGSTIMFFNYLAAIIRAIGDSTTPLVFLTISCAMNVGLVILMVGALEWGVAGAAWATVVAQAISVLLCLLGVWRRLPVLHVRRADWRVTRAAMAEHLRLGLPMGFQASIIAIGALIVQVALNTLGPEAVAAYTAAARIDSLSSALLASLGLAASMYAAQNLGARRPDRVRRGTIQALWMSVIASLALGAFMITLGAPVVSIFIGDGAPDVVRDAHLMLIINGSTYTILGVLFVLRGVLQGIGRVLVPTITGVIELIMRAAAAVIMGALLGFGGVAMGNPMAWIGAIALLIPAYVSAHRALAKMPVAPLETTLTTPIPVIGLAEGSMVADAVFTAPVPVVRPRLGRLHLPRRSHSAGRSRSARRAR
jgi:putative MATE family efflux protein